MRYKLKKGKYECYFYDSEMNLDLTLGMVLNKLNNTSIQLNKLREQYNKLNLIFLAIERKLKVCKKRLLTFVDEGL